MDFVTSVEFRASLARSPAIAIPARIAVIDDGTFGALVESGRIAGRVERHFRQDNPLAWLQLLLPWAALAPAEIISRPGATTVELARGAGDILSTARRADVVLIAAGAHDCRNAVKGTAPTATESVLALDMLAARLVAQGIRPVFLLPTPSRHFRNGLFAERFLAICATLRRIARQDSRVLIVDSASKLRAANAPGIEPPADLVSDSGTEGLTVAGARRLGQAIARVLEDGVAVPRQPMPDAPAWQGHGVTLTRHDLDWVGSAQVSRDGEHGHELRIGYAGPADHHAAQGFLRLAQQLPEAAVQCLDAGDEIEAFCDFGRVGEGPEVVALVLHASPVWSNGFAGLHSDSPLRPAGLGDIRHGRLRTPRFRLPQSLSKLNLSLSVHLAPGGTGGERSVLRFSNIILRRIGRPSHDIADRAFH